MALRFSPDRQPLDEPRTINVQRDFEGKALLVRLVMSPAVPHYSSDSSDDNLIHDD
jgi:hypothetical protein